MAVSEAYPAFFVHAHNVLQLPYSHKSIISIVYSGFMYRDWNIFRDRVKPAWQLGFPCVWIVQPHARLINITVTRPHASLLLTNAIFDVYNQLLIYMALLLLLIKRSYKKTTNFLSTMLIKCFNDRCRVLIEVVNIQSCFYLKNNVMQNTSTIKKAGVRYGIYQCYPGRRASP